jgi:hypothetical protein
MKRTFEFLAIIGLAAYFGNVINIGFTYSIAWKRMDPIAFMQGFEETFLLLLPTVAVTLLPGLIGVIVSMSLTKEHPSARKAWKMALYATLLSIAITSIYHLPVNLELIAQSYTAEEVSSKLNTWVALHWVRIVLALVASIFAIQGFQKSLEE